MYTIKKTLFTCFFISLLFLPGCLTKLEFHHNPNLNYQFIFNEDIPENVEVVNSIVYNMCSVPINISSGQGYEIELIVPPGWIEKLKSKHDMIKRNNYITNKGAPWFAPEDPKKYQAWMIPVTGYIYTLLLIDKETINNEKIHVYYTRR